jgi:hypothetical protein
MVIEDSTWLGLEDWMQDIDDTYSFNEWVSGSRSGWIADQMMTGHLLHLDVWVRWDQEEKRRQEEGEETGRRTILPSLLPSHSLDGWTRIIVVTAVTMIIIGIIGVIIIIAIIAIICGG